jgi:SAM-dependent methyltransferase
MLSVDRKPMPWIEDRSAKRSVIAAQFLSGSGIEIGALHERLIVPQTVSVSYVDRMSVADLRRQYPELANKPLVEVDIVSDGQTLAGIGDASQDFVISSHVIEHMEDPIGALKSYLRVLRTGGMIFLAVPDRRGSFDAKRPITLFEHLVMDHETGPHVSRRHHFMEWATDVNGLSGEEACKNANTNDAKDYSIHFHVWESMDFLEMLNAAKRRYRLPFDVTFAVCDEIELTAILRKT